MRVETTTASRQAVELEHHCISLLHVVELLEAAYLPSIDEAMLAKLEVTAVAMCKYGALRPSEPVCCRNLGFSADDLASDEEDYNDFEEPILLNSTFNTPASNGIATSNHLCLGLGCTHQ